MLGCVREAVDEDDAVVGLVSLLGCDCGDGYVDVCCVPLCVVMDTVRWSVGLWVLYFFN